MHTYFVGTDLSMQTIFFRLPHEVVLLAVPKKSPTACHVIFTLLGYRLKVGIVGDTLYQRRYGQWARH